MNGNSFTQEENPRNSNKRKRTDESGGKLYYADAGPNVKQYITNKKQNVSYEDTYLQNVEESQKEYPNSQHLDTHTQGQVEYPDTQSQVEYPGTNEQSDYRETQRQKAYSDAPREVEYPDIPEEIECQLIQKTIYLDRRPTTVDFIMCNQCPQLFRTENLLWNHIKGSHMKRSRAFQTSLTSTSNYKNFPNYMSKNITADPHNKVIRTYNNPSKRTMSSDDLLPANLNINKKALLSKNHYQNLARNQTVITNNSNKIIPSQQTKNYHILSTQETEPFPEERTELPKENIENRLKQKIQHIAMSSQQHNLMSKQQNLETSQPHHTLTSQLHQTVTPQQHNTMTSQPDHIVVTHEHNTETLLQNNAVTTSQPDHIVVSQEHNTKTSQLNNAVTSQPLQKKDMSQNSKITSQPEKTETSQHSNETSQPHNTDTSLQHNIDTSQSPITETLQQYDTETSQQPNTETSKQLRDEGEPNYTTVIEYVIQDDELNSCDDDLNNQEEDIETVLVINENDDNLNNELEHAQDNEPREKKYKCWKSPCQGGQVFESQERIEQHLLKEHGTVQTCDVCGAKVNNFWKHKESVHKIFRSFECPHCDTHFCSQLDRERHLRNIENKNEVKYNDKEKDPDATHARDATYARDAIDAEAYQDVHTINNEKDKEFLKSVQSKVYPCTECGWKTHSNTQYIQHVLNTCEMDPVNKYRFLKYDKHTIVQHGKGTESVREKKNASCRLIENTFTHNSSSTVNNFVEEQVDDVSALTVGPDNASMLTVVSDCISALKSSHFQVDDTEVSNCDNTIDDNQEDDIVDEENTFIQIVLGENGEELVQLLEAAPPQQIVRASQQQLDQVTSQLLDLGHVVEDQLIHLDNA